MPDTKSAEVYKVGLQVAWAVGGIYVFYIVFGVAQERINGGVYAVGLDADGELIEERFTHPLFLVFTQCGAPLPIQQCAVR